MSKPRRGGVNPWVPNQHGAWAMLFVPLLAGMVTDVAASGSFRSGSVWLTFLGICLAWVAGYFCFFAFGLWFKARSVARKRQYFKPMLTYGVAAAVGAVLALLLRPTLILWAIPFAVLVSVALWEVYRKRPRSLVSGIATTVASALMFPVMLSVSFSSSDALSAQSVFAQALSTTLVILLYFVSTIFYVKSIIRQKGNESFYKASVVYHVLACLVTVLATVPLMMQGVYFVPGVVGIGVMVASLARAIVVPKKATENPQQWTPKLVGMREMPLSLLVGIGSCFTFAL